MKTPRKTMTELSAASRSSDPAAVKQAPVDRLSVDQAPRHDVTPTITTRRARGRISVDGKRTVVRREKPHTSIYMHPAAMRTLRGIAAAEDCKPHDVLLEGLRMVFGRFGYDFDQLDRGD